MNTRLTRKMRRICAVACLIMTPAAAPAGAASTSATATTGPRATTATATAAYQGDHGFARTQTRTGEIGFARAVAVGVDENGLSVSISHVLAPPSGPAIGTSFTYTLGSSGEVAQSAGRVIAHGGRERSAMVSSAASTDGRTAVAGARAGGQTWPGGVVRATVRSVEDRGHGRRWEPVAAPRRGRFDDRPPLRFWDRCE